MLHIADVTGGFPFRIAMVVTLVFAATNERNKKWVNVVVDVVLSAICVNVVRIIMAV